VKRAGAFVLSERYGVASGTFAEVLAEEVFAEMFAVWSEGQNEKTAYHG
jgi:hypothetical protein